MAVERSATEDMMDKAFCCSWYAKVHGLGLPCGQCQSYKLLNWGGTGKPRKDAETLAGSWTWLFFGTSILWFHLFGPWKKWFFLKQNKEPNAQEKMTCSRVHPFGSIWDLSKLVTMSIKPRCAKEGCVPHHFSRELKDMQGEIFADESSVLFNFKNCEIVIPNKDFPMFNWNPKQTFKKIGTCSSLRGVSFLGQFTSEKTPGFCAAWGSFVR